MKTWAHFGTYVAELSEKLKEAGVDQEEEKKNLKETRNLISNSMINEETKPEVKS